jgi:leucine efflux protein
LRAKPGDAPILKIKPRHYLRQALLITLLNPKAIVFYMAFFPLFVDPLHHQGMKTFAVMAATIAGLTFLYGLTATLLTHFLAERLRANPQISALMQKLAGIFLIGFGIKLAISR